MLASLHRWETNRSSCPRAALCMQIVCIFILLHSVYDNSSLSLHLSLALLFFSSSLSRVFSTNARRKMSKNKNDIRRFYYLVSKFTKVFYLITKKKETNFFNYFVWYLSEIVWPTGEYLFKSPEVPKTIF